MPLDILLYLQIVRFKRRLKPMANKRINYDLTKNKVDTKHTSIFEIEISELRDNPFNPRMEIQPEALSALASSIKQQGLLQPIIVAKEGDTLTIIAGHLRVEAHKYLQIKYIKAIIKEDVVHAQLAILPLIENLQRIDTHSIENTIALKHILNEGVVKTQEELADLLCVSKDWLSKRLSGLRLPDDLLETIKEDGYNDITVISALNKIATKDLHTVYDQVKTLKRIEALFFIKSLSTK